MNLILNQPRQNRTPTGLLFIVPGPTPGKPRMTKRDTWKKRPPVLRYRMWADLARLIAGPMPDPADVARPDEPFPRIQLGESWNA